MRKNIFIILLIVITFTGCGTAKSVNLVGGQQQRGEESTRIFDTWSGKTDFASYIIEQSGKITKDEASDLVKIIEEDADKVDAYFGNRYSMKRISNSIAKSLLRRT